MSLALAAMAASIPASAAPADATIVRTARAAFTFDIASLGLEKDVELTVRRWSDGIANKDTARLVVRTCRVGREPHDCRTDRARFELKPGELIFDDVLQTAHLYLRSGAFELHWQAQGEPIVDGPHSRSSGSTILGTTETERHVALSGIAYMRAITPRCVENFFEFTIVRCWMRHQVTTRASAPL